MTLKIISSALERVTINLNLIIYRSNFFYLKMVP